MSRLRTPHGPPPKSVEGSVAAPFSTWSRKILEHTLNPSEIHPHFTPTVFTRHNRFLHTFMHANQAWFCVQDLGRLMGRPLDQRLTLKLDPDQRQQVLLLRNGKTTESLMVSESGMYALLVHHFVPENRNLRQWLSNEVIPTLRESGAAVDNIPSLSSLQWAGVSVPLLHWQHQAWIKWRDMPDLMQVQRPLKILGTCS